MPSPALFDFDAFSQTAMDVSKVDYDWHSLPDKTEGLAQIVKLGGSSMEEYREKFNNRDVIRLELEWEFKDPSIGQEMNMDRVIVRQQLLVELTAPPPPKGNGVPKWGVNENQQLKDLIRAVGLSAERKFNWSMLRNQLGWIVTRNRTMEGSDRVFSEVHFVKDANAGRTAYEARLSRANGASAP